MKKYILSTLTLFCSLNALATDIDCFRYQSTTKSDDYVCIESKGDLPLPFNVSRLFFADIKAGAVVPHSAVAVSVKESDIRYRCPDCMAYDVTNAEKVFEISGGRSVKRIDLTFSGSKYSMDSAFADDSGSQNKTFSYEMELITDSDIKDLVMSQFNR